MKFEYDTTDYIRKINKGNSYFDTFLNKESLAAGILILKPGEEDTQLPHDSDEMSVSYTHLTLPTSDLV